MNRYFEKIRSYPIILGLALTQVVIAVVFIYLSANYVNSIENRLFDDKVKAIREDVLLQINNTQNKWRAWYFMGMSTAIEKDISLFEAKHPYAKISIIKMKDILPTGGKELIDDLIIPPLQPDSVDAVIRVQFDRKKISETIRINGEWKNKFLPIFGICLFFISILSFTFIVFALIYRPIEKFMYALATGGEVEGELSYQHFRAMGEIKRILEEFKSIMESKRKLQDNAWRLEQENSKNKAIAQTTQMLAHDVRKPFSILQMGLEMLGGAKNMSGVKETLNNIAPEVARALASVNGMINDVMEVGRASAPQREPVSPESIIESSLSELCRIYPDSNVKFSYDLKHIHMLDVDPLKVGRVFSNIMGNAVQAMKERGKIWIKTTEVGGEITICLGNDGSFINPKDIQNLFEAFFTKNKKGGTGLGLAIAQKVVMSHGGKIWCTSSEQDRTVEFHFTLPIAQNRLNQTTAQLPSSTKQVIEAYNRSMTASNMTDDEDNASQTSYGNLEQRIVDASRALHRKVTIAIIDDEAVYRNAVRGLLDKSEVLNECLKVELFSTSAPLIAAFKKQKYDILVCDIDLGRDSMDGYEIVKELRESHYDTTICIHSNRSLPEDYAKSVEVGAQAFLPKPMARTHLLKLLCQALEKQVKAMQEGVDKAPVSKPRLFALVDDSKLVRLTWQQFWSVGRLVTFSSPKEFWNHVNINPSFLDDLSGVITDFHFEEGCREDGWDFAKALRNKASQLPIVLASNGEYKLDDFEDGFFNAIMDKKTPTLQAIMQAFGLK